VDVPSSPRILLLDSDTDLTAGLVELLRRDGFAVDATDATIRFFALLDANVYDVAVVEQVPERDWDERLVERPAAAGRVRHVVFTSSYVLASSNGGREPVQYAWLKRPFKAADLVALVRRLLAR